MIAWCCWLVEESVPNIEPLDMIPLIEGVTLLLPLALLWISVPFCSKLVLLWGNQDTDVTMWPAQSRFLQRGPPRTLLIKGRGKMCKKVKWGAKLYCYYNAQVTIMFRRRLKKDWQQHLRNNPMLKPLVRLCPKEWGVENTPGSCHFSRHKWVPHCLWKVIAIVSDSQKILKEVISHDS